MAIGTLLGGRFDWGGENSPEKTPLVTPEEQGGWLDFLKGDDDEEDDDAPATGGGLSGWWDNLTSGVKGAVERNYVDGLLTSALEGDEFAGYDLANYKVTNAGREFSLTDTGKKWLAIAAFGAVALWIMQKR
ncbi:hypothetical protein [Neotabrizicola shimadae]|uniref:Uncharacterized protein n=1 Tax=Neotabrizicola shimadae TaxID=2807096 RepID=A0A8G1EEF0_9RHOB|nr:hypothetical protein [Neotabrizicola shimadae]QYZ71218.1 hypothetical protein JO391_06855 [Neotabrizicola shimadae]